MDFLDTVVQALGYGAVGGAVGAAAFKGFFLILAKLGLDQAKNDVGRDVLNWVSAEVEKANARADASHSRAATSDEQAARVSRLLAEALGKIAALTQAMELIEKTNQRLELEVKQLREELYAERTQV